MSKIWTRMGDGQAVKLIPTSSVKTSSRRPTTPQTRATSHRSKNARSRSSSKIFSAPWRVIGVEPGHEVPLTKDETACTLVSSQLSSGSHLPISREAAVEIFERVFAFDTMELGWIDYSFKQAKPMVSLDQVSIERLLAHRLYSPSSTAQCRTWGCTTRLTGRSPTRQTFYGMMKVEEAREMQMKASELCEEDMVFVCKRMAEIGADGIDFDTTASAGDADFLAVLRTVEELKKTTNLGIEVGMSGEFVLGMHGEVEYKGTKLAGLWPHQQLKVVEQAGADIFGPVVNTKTNKSAPWNVARAVTFVKEVCKQATVPVHANVGMGVGGTPMFRPRRGRPQPRERRDGRDRQGGRVVGGRRRSFRNVPDQRSRPEWVAFVPLEIWWHACSSITG